MMQHIYMTWSSEWNKSNITSVITWFQNHCGSYINKIEKGIFNYNYLIYFEYHNQIDKELL